jgi:hypothetical protein
VIIARPFVVAVGYLTAPSGSACAFANKISLDLGESPSCATSPATPYFVAAAIPSCGGRSPRTAVASSTPELSLTRVIFTAMSIMKGKVFHGTLHGSPPSPRRVQPGAAFAWLLDLGPRSVRYDELAALARRAAWLSRTGLSEGECVDLGARIGKCDLEGAVDDGTGLADDLVQPLFGRRSAARWVAIRG